MKKSIKKNGDQVEFSPLNDRDCVSSDKSKKSYEDVDNETEENEEIDQNEK